MELKGLERNLNLRLVDRLAPGLQVSDGGGGGGALLYTNLGRHGVHRISTSFKKDQIDVSISLACYAINTHRIKIDIGLKVDCSALSDTRITFYSLVVHVK